MGYKKNQRAVYETGQHFGWSSIWMGPFFQNARYMNGVGFEILARTPVPKLPLSYRPPTRPAPTPPPPHPPPPPPPPQELKSRHSERCEAVFFKNFSVTIYRPFFFFFFFLFSFFLFFFLNLIYDFFMYFIILLSFIILLRFLNHLFCILFFFLSFIFFLSYIFFIH